jgi:hypothetical protein
VNRLLCTCGKSYEVSTRAPGSKVKCRACETVLTVPGERPHDAARSASERLRRARGEPCARHPKTIALDPCERCGRWMCLACRAPAPSSHLCTDCAPAVGATSAIALDFGLLATALVAARITWRALPWVFLLNALANAAKWLIVIPFGLAAIAIAYMVQGHAEPTTSDKILAFGSFATCVLVIGLFDAVLIPAADIVLFDRALREWHGPEGMLEKYPAGLGASLKTAFSRAWTRKGNLLLAYALLVSAVLGGLLVLLPFVLAYHLTQDVDAMNLGKLVAMPLSGAILGAFGLSIPAVILEHRSATEAFGRAWQLARLRPWVATIFGTVFVMVGVIVTNRLGEFQAQLGYPGLVISLVLAFVADIAWPALLVAAYHGLVAEEARLVGRRS